MVMLDCIEKGIEQGWSRAHKNTDTPKEQEIKHQIAHYIEISVTEYFTFNDNSQKIAV
jgi:hypothetical protein